MVVFHSTYAQWIDMFRDDRNWAEKWPAEVVWKVRED